MAKKIKLRDLNFLHNSSGLSIPRVSKDIKKMLEAEWDRTIYDRENVVYTDMFVAKSTMFDAETSNKYAWVMEPPAIMGNLYIYLKDYAKDFTKVFGPIRELEKIIPNYKYVPFGGTWLEVNKDLMEGNRPETEKRDVEFSIIASAKNTTIGHRLRHLLIGEIRSKGLNVEVCGKGYKEFDMKEEVLNRTKYAIEIENSFHDGYFTEKLIDAIMCDTIPVYVGHPGTFVGTGLEQDGMIFINPEGKSPQEIVQKLVEVIQNPPEVNLESLAKNRKTATRFLIPDRHIWQEVFA